MLGEWAPARALFRLDGLPEPELCWSPAPDALGCEEFALLLEYWNSLKGGAQAVSINQIDPIMMKENLGYLLLLDVIESGQDFRYRVYGSKIADLKGVDHTGKLLSDAVTDTNSALFLIACYRAVVRRSLPLFNRYAVASPTSQTSEWRRLILPLADDHGAISRLLIGCRPSRMRNRDQV